ncbi:MAG: hypothetical protein ACPGUE_18455 [Marinomonas sp.]|jgi:hypothetical protein|uniref:hypothetical protein n=1 Tax=unclassified Marinomonas TaxID=196814 RepID=UPI0005FA9573|nr:MULTISPECIES: hypothetical protein [unclassified Marinomonas]KJZ10696.1 hypothetical protein TW85_19595 [Marinomonas sp. S3726]KZM38949.1 hypothetical protein OA92_21495 [Marinomonas sp. SBI22]KZM39636.1 hypothetical protein OA91_21345 [Marinomonas sp. SBI8L]
MLIELEKAQTRNNLVRIFREELDGPDNWSDGFIIDANEEMVLLQLVDDSIRLNGYQILFLEDISDFVHPAPFNDFQKKVLELREEEAQNPEIELGDLSQILLDISEDFGLVTLHREELESDSCEIGRVVKADEVSFELEEIGSDARWFDETYEYDLYDITRIEFGGAYEEALLLVNDDLGEDSYELNTSLEESEL